MTSPTLLSVQVGQPADYGADAISDTPWRSGIFKLPVTGRVRVDSLNVAGDGQEDRKNHGGPFRAVLAYSADHYLVWNIELGRKLDYGSFGENFTVAGLAEDNVCLGDVYTVGEVSLQVTQPRYPCWKLARRVGVKDLAERVERNGWGGWYNRVLQTGYAQAGDTISLIERRYPHYSIAFLNDLLMKRITNPAACAELAALDVLSPEWRELYARLARSCRGDA